MKKEGRVKEEVGHEGEKKEEMGGKNCAQMMMGGNKEKDLAQRRIAEKNDWADKQLEGRRSGELAETVRHTDRQTNTGGIKNNLSIK